VMEEDGADRSRSRSKMCIKALVGNFLPKGGVAGLFALRCLTDWIEHTSEILQTTAVLSTSSTS
jgi:hypothetical protein